MFDLLSGLLSCVGDDIAKTKSKKKQLIISLIFGFLIFLAICIEEFFANSSANLILFALGLSFLSSMLIFMYFLIANLLKKK